MAPFCCTNCGKPWTLLTETKAFCLGAGISRKTVPPPFPLLYTTRWGWDKGYIGQVWNIFNNGLFLTRFETREVSRINFLEKMSDINHLRFFTFSEISSDQTYYFIPYSFLWLLTTCLLVTMTLLSKENKFPLTEVTIWFYSHIFKISLPVIRKT